MRQPTRHHTSRLLVAAVPLALAACGDDATSTAAPDVTADAAASDDATAEDAAAPDAAPPDDGPPKALVYRVDPLTTPTPETVGLEHLASEAGELTGLYARVRSCTPDKARGQVVPVDFGGLSLTLTTCVPESIARPEADGDYDHIAPPAAEGDPDDAFSEVMMYHHMQVIHDFFKDVHGLTDRDAPLDAITNVQAHVDLCDSWTKIANAAFIPKESLAELPFGIDLGIDGDAIVFSGTDTRNFAFDAAVIYHEYTHAMLGATRLNAVFADGQGLNNLPGALNEAYADYFAGAITNASAVGNYALNDLGTFAVCGFPLGSGGNLARDMANTRTCPDDLTAEVHADSEIFSSALWQIRTELGAVDADRVILAGVLSLTNASDFQVAAEATIDAARDLLGEAAEAQVQAAFEARTILGCARVLPAARVGARGLALTLEPNNAFQPNPYPNYTPGYLQVGFAVPAGATRVELALEFGAAQPGAPAPSVELALKPGGEPVTYTFGLGAGSVRHDAPVTLTVTSGKATLEAADGETLAEGAWVFSIHNKGDGASLSGVRVTDRTPR